MARAKIDEEAVRERLLDAAEEVLAETRGRRLVLSDVAARVGQSQSYAHRFFRTKSDLVAALAARWFAEVEGISRRIAHGPGSAEERLKDWYLTILRLKRDRHDSDPQLFTAYFALASGHEDVVGTHVARMDRDLARIVAALPGIADPAAATVLLQDAMLLFHQPACIAAQRPRATDARAIAVLTALLPSLNQRQ